jgi:hypothetical protein
MPLCLEPFHRTTARTAFGIVIDRQLTHLFIPPYLK